jgi:hypothetical protein
VDAFSLRLYLPVVFAVLLFHFRLRS